MSAACMSAPWHIVSSTVPTVRPDEPSWRCPHLRRFSRAAVLEARWVIQCRLRRIGYWPRIFVTNLYYYGKLNMCSKINMCSRRQQLPHVLSSANHINNDSKFALH
jgi:hypothetical protein